MTSRIRIDSDASDNQEESNSSTSQDLQSESNNPAPQHLQDESNSPVPQHLPYKSNIVDGANLADHSIVDAIHEAITAREPVAIVGTGSWQRASAPRTLSLTYDTGIVAYNPDDLTITVRAGTSLHDIDETLHTHQQWLPLDPQGARTGTIGATVATCSYGPLAQFFGTPRDLVLGLTVVTGDGTILKSGGRVVKNVAGFDLTRLMIGAWGTLGVITQVTLRVMAQTRSTASFTHMRRKLPGEYGYRKPVMTHPRLSIALKQRFDPHNILNPGFFTEVL